MKFWMKLDLSIILMIAMILSCSRFIVVRQNFKYSIENSVEQNTNQHRLERYSLESNVINDIQLGEEVTNEKIVQSIQMLCSYMESDSGKVAVFGKEKEMIFCNFDKIEKVRVEELFYEEIDNYCIRKIGNEQYMLFFSHWSINNEEIYMLHFYDVSVIYKMREKQLKEIMYTDIIILVIASIFISFFSKFLTKPIEELNETSKKISSGKFNERTKIKTNDEIGELAESFNKMAAEIEYKINFLKQSNQAKDDFMTGFSHEIKTPMTAIIGYSDLLRLKKCDEEITTKALNYIYSEAKRLEELSYKLLSLMELTEDRIDFQCVKIKEFVEKVTKKMDLQEVRLKLDLQNAVVEIDENLLEVVIRNLVQNAKKAEPKDKCITIVGELWENHKYRISVIDCGRGIPKEHLGRVMEDFYMVDKSRSKQNGGTGIGLSLCRKILEFHHSEIKIESEENVGTKVYFELEVVE